MSPDFGANIAEIVSPSFLPSASESRANDERSRRENKICRNLGCENDSIDDSKHAIEGVETKNQKEIIERLKRESNGAKIARKTVPFVRDLSFQHRLTEILTVPCLGTR